MAVESQISPVRDPTYDRFDFQGLLDRASQPLATLAQGQLAIASRNNERQFEQQAELQRENLAQRNRIAEQQNYANLTEQQRLRLQNESDQQLYAKSGYKPDPNLSRAQNVEKAANIQEDKSYEGFKSVSDSAAKAQNDLNGLIQKSGMQVTPGFDQVKQRVLNDPALDQLLTANHIFPFSGQNGDVVRKAITDAKSITDINKVMSDYIGASSDRAAILGSVQKATTDLTAINQENAVRQLGAQAQALQSRYNLNNELAQTLIKSAAPDQQARYAIYHANNTGTPPVTPGLAVPVPKAPVAAAPAPSQDLASFADAPGTPQNQSVAYYSAVQEQQAHRTAASTVDDELKNAMAQKDALIQKLQPGAKAPDYASAGGAFGSSGPATIPYVNSEKLGFAKQLQQVNKQIETLKAQKQTHLDALNNLVVPQNPATAPASQQPSPTSPPLPAFPQLSQPLPPAQPVPNSNGAQMMDFSQPQPQQPPSAQNGQPQNPVLHQQIQSKIFQLLGTSDPNQLAQIRNYAQSIGVGQQQSQQLLGAAINGDQVAIQKVKQIVQGAQGGLGQTASAPVGAMSQGASDFSQVAGFSG